LIRYQGGKRLQTGKDTRKIVFGLKSLDKFHKVIRREIEILRLKHQIKISVTRLQNAACLACGLELGKQVRMASFNFEYLLREREVCHFFL
jgi:hypothetical protein